MVEYALLCALIAIASIGALRLLGQTMERGFDKPAQALANPGTYDPNGSGMGSGCQDCE